MSGATADRPEHRTELVGKTTDPVVHGRCSCGWTGPERTGRDRRWQAGADCDEHVNDES